MRRIAAFGIGMVAMTQDRPVTASPDRHRR
jgi:hypothetical protein